MNTAILSEVRFFLTSFLWGAFFFVCYDCLLIVRNIIKHHRIVIAIEDIIFWVSAGIAYFRMTYQLNHGTIRWYSIAGLLLGMFLYNNTLSTPFIKFFTFVIKKILWIIRSIFAFFLRPIRFLMRKLKKLFLFLKNKVEKRAKRISKFTQKQLKKHEEKVKIKREKKRAEKETKQEEASVVHKSKKGSFELILQQEEKGDEHEQDKSKKKKNRT